MNFHYIESIPVRISDLLHVDYVTIVAILKSNRKKFDCRTRSKT